MLLKWLLDSNQIYFLFIKTMDAKRVWDSNKKAVWQNKEQVWLVDGEKKVNTNHGFEEAT
jgi:hypothetical protein